MSRSYLRLIAAIGLGFATSIACADEAEVVYYDIVGNNAKELRRELGAKGPIGENGTTVDGHTNWHVRWNFRYAPTAEGCRFTEFVVNVTGEIVLPRWAAGEKASNALAKKWQSYVVALRVHEDGHYTHGVRAADEVKALGQSFRVSGSCSTIGQLFNDRAESILNKFRAADATYDADTDHGRTQGARFP